MNTKTLVVTVSVIGGLIGLAVLANCFAQEAPPLRTDRRKVPAPDDDQKPEASTPGRAEIRPPDLPKADIKLPGDDGNNPERNREQPEPKVTADTFMPQEEERPAPQIVVPVAPSRPQPAGDEFPLRIGSKGTNVERLQVFLLRNYGHTGKITGVFDELTAVELKRRLNKTELDEATFRRYRMGKHVHEQVIIR